MSIGWLNNPMTQTYTIGLEDGGFKGQKSGFSNNDLLPGESPLMYNYFAGDAGLTKRKGILKSNRIALQPTTGVTGLHRHFDGSFYHTLVKCGSRLYDLDPIVNSPYLLQGVTEAGDSNSQLSVWVFSGGNNGNTNFGVLYWELIWDGTDATVNVYKNADGAAGNKVATGIGAQNTTIVLNEVNYSRLTGSVDVGTKNSDDTDLATNTLIFATVSASAEMSFVSWFGKYFATEGIDLYAGTNGSAAVVALLDEDGDPLAGVEPHGRWLAVHKQRLWMTGDPSYPTRVYFSETDFYDRFNTAGGLDVAAWVACDRDDGIAITGFVQYNDKLLVMKPTKSYWILGDFTMGDLVVIDAFPNGAWDQKTIISCPDGFVRWFGPGGVWEYADGLGMPRHISRNIDFDLNKIPVNYRQKACAAFFEHYYMLWVPSTDASTFNDMGYVYDTYRQAWYPMRGWSIARMICYENNTLYGGLADGGFVSRMFFGTSDDGNDITAFYRSKRNGIPGIEQCLYSVRPFNVQAGGTTSIIWGADAGSPARGEFLQAFTGVGTYIDDFILDEDVLVANEDIMGDVSSPAFRCDNSQRFLEIFFDFSETSSVAHSIGYLSYRAYPIREVV